MVIGLLFFCVLASLFTAAIGVVLEAGIGLVVLSYVLGGMCGGIFFLRLAWMRTAKVR